MTTPPYNPNIPQPKNTIADGQIDFLNNFSKLFEAFSQDHVALNDPNNPGNHNVARLFEQANTPQTNVGEIALYSKNVPVQTDQLFFRSQGNATEIQYTNYQLYDLQPVFLGPIQVQTPYFTYLPGGIIVYFGSVLPVANGHFLILEPAICSNVIGINLCPIASSNLFQSNPAPIVNSEGKIGAIRLTSSNLDVTPPPQYYIVFGVI